MDTTHIFLIGPRACGKTTVAMHLGNLLPSWLMVDVDQVWERRNRSRQRSQLMVHSEAYYEGCREIVIETLAQPRAVVSMGGGTLINPHYPTGDIDVLVECKKHGPMVLLLPTAFDFRNRRILYGRERARSYEMPQSMIAKLREATYSQYNTRIDFFRQNADLTLYGSNPNRLAAKVSRRYNLPTRQDPA